MMKSCVLNQDIAWQVEENTSYMFPQGICNAFTHKGLIYRPRRESYLGKSTGESSVSLWYVLFNVRCVPYYLEAHWLKP